MNYTQFLLDLTHLYYAANPKPLRKELLHHYLTLFGELYISQTFTASGYKLYLEACLDALTSFTKHIHHAALENDTPSLFKTTKNFSEYVLCEVRKGKYQFQTGQSEAYRAMCQAFLSRKPAFKQFNLFTWTGHTPTEHLYYPTMGYYDSEKSKDAAERRYEKDLVRYNKESAQAFSDAHPLQAALAGVPLYTFWPLFAPEIPISLPLTIEPKTWFSGCWVCAPPNKGKTNLMHNIIRDRRAHGTVVLMDASKTELIAPYFNDADYLITPSINNPPQLNPLDIGSSLHSVELLEYLFSSLLEAKMTPKQSVLFSGVLTLLVTIPDATVETFRQVLLDGWKSYDHYVLALPRRNQEFFTKGVFDDKEYRSTKTELLWRLELLLRNPYMAAMLEVPHTTLNFASLLDSGNLILIDNNPDTLGNEGAEFFGRLFIALLWNTVRTRSRHTGHKTPVFFFIDEAQAVIKRDENIVKLLHQCRSQNVALIFSHQQLQQITSENVQLALGDCAIRLGAPDREAARLAPFFHVEAEFFQQLPPYHFAACIRDKETVAVTVPLLNLPLIPRPSPLPPPKPPLPTPLPPSFPPQTGPEEIG